MMMVILSLAKNIRIKLIKMSQNKLKFEYFKDEVQLASFVNEKDVKIEQIILRDTNYFYRPYILFYRAKDERRTKGE